MPARLRLQRKGKKRAPYYHIVAADSRSTRDGKYIERLGHYNPNVNPADIEIDREKALQWLKNGAQPSDTLRAILQYSGVMYQLHLDGGVKKGAITQEQADEKLTAWLQEKASKISAKRESISTDKSQKEIAALAAEVKIKEERAAKILARTFKLEEAAKAESAAAEVTEGEATETPAADGPAAESADAPAVEGAPAAEPTPKTPATEAAPEASATEAKPETATETKPETPSEVEAKPEAPAAEAKPETPAEVEAKPAEGSEPPAEKPKGE